MSGSMLPRRLGRCRVSRIEDLREVQQLVETTRIAFFEVIAGDDETLDELDEPLHTVAHQHGGVLLLVEHEMIVVTPEDAGAAAKLAADALTRFELRAPDAVAMEDALHTVEEAARRAGGGVWEIDDGLFVAAPYDIVSGPRRGRGESAGDRVPLRPSDPTLSGAAALPLPGD